MANYNKQNMTVEEQAKIFGTEKDKINCPFYAKIGACRHGDRCSRVHHKPLSSQTVLIKNMYRNAADHMSVVDGQSLEYDDEESQKHFEEFFEDIHGELSKFGKIEDIQVCQNLGEHMMGNTYVKYSSEEEARNVWQNLNGRYYAGVPLYVEFSPVTNFTEARCRQFDQGECTRGGFCNFLHLRKISRNLLQKVFPNGRPGDERRRRGGGDRDGDNRRSSYGGRDDRRDDRRGERRERSRSPERRRRSRSRSRERDHKRSRHSYDDRDRRDRDRDYDRRDDRRDDRRESFKEREERTSAPYAPPSSYSDVPPPSIPESAPIPPSSAPEPTRRAFTERTRPAEPESKSEDQQ